MEQKPQTTGAEIAPLDKQGISPFDALRKIREDGSEFWSARELMPSLGYTQWRRFQDSIERAIVSCGNSGNDPSRNFAGTGKVSGTRGPKQSDYQLSRFGAYLVAMNGDPRKQEIADAQAYFAIKTHEAEIASPQIDVPRTYKEALLALVDAENEKERLALEAQNARTALKEASGAIDFHKRVTRAVNAQSVAQVGKVLQIGPRKIWGFLQSQRFVYKQGNNWVPKQDLIEQKLFTVAEKVRTDDNGQDFLYVQTLVTGKGIEWIQRKWDEYMGQMVPA